MQSIVLSALNEGTANTFGDYLATLYLLCCAQITDKGLFVLTEKDFISIGNTAYIK